MLVIPFIDYDVDLDTVVEDLGLYLPLEARYYGCREDHCVEEDDGFQWIHSCLVVLVTADTLLPMQKMRAKVDYWMNGRPRRRGVSEADDPKVNCRVRAYSCPITVRDDGSPCYDPLRIARWVLNIYRFITAAGRGASRSCLKRAVFGDIHIFRVLERQFGAELSSSVIKAIDRVLQIRNRKDGVSVDRYVPSLCDSGNVKEMIYVKA